MIGIIDTESQNIGSLVNCLNYLKIKNSLIKNPNDLKKFKKIILPGVGSFDAVILATDHDDFNYSQIAKYAKIIIDTRGRFKQGSNIVKA